MKKIGILTWFHWNNYGTVLQAYALNRYLNQEGYLAETINVVPDYSKEDFELTIWLKRIIRNLLLHREKLQSIDTCKENKVEANKEKQFQKFREGHIVFSIPVSENDYQSVLNQYDAIVMGSDQIWHPGFYKRMYFGAKLDRKKLIAYAPSMGSVQDVENFERKKDMIHLIRRIPYIAVREEKSAEYLRKRFHIKAECVVDPTFLLTREQWNTIADEARIEVRNSRKPYLCIYLLEKHNREKKIEYAQQLAKAMELELRILPIFEDDIELLGTVDEKCGPAEFLDMIKNASMVLTDSFHGMVFCGIFGTRFLALERYSNADNCQQNERIYHLLALFGADICLCSMDIEKDLRTADQVDYQRLLLNVQGEIEHAKRYLQQALTKVGNG